jgi:hypothetical protein
VADPTTLAQRRPDTADARREAAVNLFTVLSCAHRSLHLALTRSARSSIDPAAVSPSGHVQDLYYLVGPGDLPGAGLSRCQRLDIARALNLILGLGGGQEETRELLAVAVTAYWHASSLPPSLTALADQVICDREGLANLAAAVLAGSW